MRFVAYIILAIGSASAILGVLEGRGFTELRDIASHESFWEFADSCFLASIAFFLAELVHQGRRKSRGRY